MFIEIYVNTDIYYLLKILILGMFVQHITGAHDCDPHDTDKHPGHSKIGLCLDLDNMIVKYHNLCEQKE